MVIKRKRSESELSFSSAFSSPPRPGSSAFDFGAMGASNWGALSSRPSTPSHLHSRTLKRFRDNRPSEAEVHQRTLNLLFSAQYQHPTPCEAEPQVDTVMTSSTAQESQGRRDVQRSLHSFWRLPVTAPDSARTLPSPPIVAHSAAMDCEDCGAGLGDDDIMMDIDALGSEGHSCGACGKMVCKKCWHAEDCRHVRGEDECDERNVNKGDRSLCMLPELSGYPAEELVCFII